MKHKRIVIALVLLVSLLLSSCGLTGPRTVQTAPNPAETAADTVSETAPETAASETAPETAAEPAAEPAAPSDSREAPSTERTATPMAASGGKVETTKVKTDMFRAKFEGDAVAGSGEAVDGVYRFVATETDGEAWHVKLECSYPTVAGRDYRVTYRFRSDVAGKVKFGDFQEFAIEKGENSVTGILIASGGSTYLDLQLGMLPPFTIDFTEIEVEEYADVVDYENALSAPVSFLQEAAVYEAHDEGYDPVLTRTADAVSVNFRAVSSEPGVWKSRLFIRTGLIPEPGVRYHIAADISGDRDLPFEVLFNNGGEEKGYGALYGQSLAAGETKSVEAVITGVDGGGELVLQFSLGEAPEESTVKIDNLRVDKIKDHYTNELPAHFALDTSVATGKTIYGAIPVSFKNVPLTNFSYSGVDTVYEGHDDGYVVNLTETAASATYAITQAPSDAAERRVWRARLYASTGVELEADTTYQISFDLASESDQANYEVLLSGDSAEAYGASKGRSLTAGAADHIELVVTPDENHGPLTLCLQLGETDTAAGNTVTLSNLSLQKLEPTYQEVGTSALETGGEGSVSEEHYDGIEQTLTVSGDSAALNITAARSEGAGGVWSSKLLIKTGITPDAGAKYRVGATVDATGATGEFEFLLQNTGSDELYGAQKNLSGAGDYSVDFTAPASGCGELVLVFQLGNAAADNTVTVSGLQVCKISGESFEDVELTGFAYPVVTEGSTAYNDFDLYVNEAAAAELTGDGASATVTVTTPSTEAWHVKLYAKPGLELKANTSYTISLDVSGADGCTANFKNTAAEGENGFGSETVSGGSVTHTVVTTASGTMEIVLEIGSVAEGAAVTVSNIVIKETTTDFIPMTLSGFAYPSVTHNPASDGSFAVDAGATLSSSAASSATATVNTPGADWSIKFYVKPQMALESGKLYRVSVNVAGANGCQLCFKDLSAPGDVAETAYGDVWLSSDNQTVSKDIMGSGGVMEIFVKIGALDAGSEVTLSGVKIEEYTNLDLSGTTYELQFNTKDGGTPGEGEWSSTSNTFTITKTPDPQDGWVTKFFIDPHVQVMSGKQYRASFTLVSEHDGFDIEFLNPDPWNDQAHGGKVWFPSNQVYTRQFEGENDWMQIIVHAGWVAPRRSVTVSNLTITDLSSVTDKTPAITAPTPESDTVTPNSFSLAAENGAAAALGGDGSSSATVTVSAAGTAAGDIVLTANTGAELEKDKDYRIKMNVTGANGCTVTFMNATSGAASGFGTATIESGAVTHTVKPDETGTLSIRALLGSVPAETTVTVSGIEVSEYKFGDLDVTPDFAYPSTTEASVDGKSFKVEANEGAMATLTGDGSGIATATVTKPGDDWHVKFYAFPRLALEAGGTYQVSLRVQNASGCDVCFKDPSADKDAETAYGVYKLKADDETVVQTVTGTGGELEILLKIGAVAKNTEVSISGVSIKKLSGETLGDNLMTDPLTAASSGNVSFWAHEDYAAALSGDGSSASLAISNAPAEGKEAWKVKLFVDTGIALEAGKLYRVSADVSSDAEFEYQLCCTDGESDAQEHLLAPVKSGLFTADGVQTVTCDAAPGFDATLNLQFNLGMAAAPCTVTLSNVKVEEMVEGESENVLPSFSYDSVGSFSSAADDGYIVSLDKASSSATFHIHQAPAERHPWNVKLNVNTGFTPEKQKGYRVSFDISADRDQGVFEVFFDGDTEGAYGQFFGMSLPAGKTSFSQLIMPGDSKGRLVLQLRLGQTDGTDGNSYTVSNVTIEEVTFRYTQTPEMKEVTVLSTQNGYVEQLEKTRDRATVRIEKTPAEGREAWKSKLFVETGVTLKAGQKYRVSMDVKSIIPAPFEVCFNNGGVEKGVGAIFGLISTPTGQHVEYVTYAKQDAPLVIQLSLGNCEAPNSLTLSGLSVEKAGPVELISDTIYTF